MTRSSLSRGALLGAFLGSFGAALLLCFFAYTTMSRPCANPGTEECVFEDALNERLARTQCYAALGLSFISAGMFLLLRRRPVT